MTVATRPGHAYLAGRVGHPVELHTQDQDPRDSGYPRPRARVPYWKSGPPRRRTFEPEGFFQQGRKGLVTSTEKLRQTQMRKRAERSEITENL